MAEPTEFLDQAGLTVAFVGLLVAYIMLCLWSWQTMLLVLAVHAMASIEGDVAWRWALIPPALYLFGFLVGFILEGPRPNRKRHHG